MNQPDHDAPPVDLPSDGQPQAYLTNSTHTLCTLIHAPPAFLGLSTARYAF